jgi:hypothetical protein
LREQRNLCHDLSWHLVAMDKPSSCKRGVDKVRVVAGIPQVWTAGVPRGVDGNTINGWAMEIETQYSYDYLGITREMLESYAEAIAVQFYSPQMVASIARVAQIAEHATLDNSPGQASVVLDFDGRVRTSTHVF